MTQRTRAALAIALFLIPACVAKKKTVKTGAALPPGHVRYAGVLPCPRDCKGVRTDLTLNESNRTFVMKETFMGTHEGDETVVSKGEWTHLKGHGRNENATVVELTSESFDQERYFLRLGQDALRVLDSQGREFLTKENSVLLRQEVP